MESVKRDLEGRCREKVKQLQDAHHALGYTAWANGRPALERGFLEGILWLVEQIRSGLADADHLRLLKAAAQELIDEHQAPPLYRSKDE